jgi:hypothetical protein
MIKEQIVEKDSLSKEEKQILLHTLGLYEGIRFYETYKIDKPYRNYFYTSKNTVDYSFIEKLIAKGLMADSGRGGDKSGSIYFFVTNKGINLAKKIARDSVVKLSRGQKRYQLYLHSEAEETFGEWLKNSYWNNYRKEYGV